MHHIPEGLGKIALFYGEMGKRDNTVKALMETAPCWKSNRRLSTSYRITIYSY
jgi:hypothetical protein